MYSIKRAKYKGNVIGKIELEGFLMGLNGKVYKIGGADVSDISISDKSLAEPIVTSQVMKKYNKLIEYLTELLVSDDDTGDAMREALNQIERFRIQIKNKYRKFLKKKELELMSKQLVKLQKAANQRLLELHDSYLQRLNNKRSK